MSKITSKPQLSTSKPQLNDTKPQRNNTTFIRNGKMFIRDDSCFLRNSICSLRNGICAVLNALASVSITLVQYKIPSEMLGKAKQTATNKKRTTLLLSFSIFKLKIALQIKFDSLCQWQLV